MVNLSVLEQFLNHIARFSLCKTTDKILLAVSGGLDSMVLLHLMTTAGFKVSVAHGNFQLRGAESDGDEEAVREACARYKTPFFSKKFHTSDYATQKGISIQMAARELRYEFFETLIQSHAFDRLATAHHFNDSVETAFLNLTRGTGIQGLTGIAVKRDKTIRPLLFATRKMLLAYAETNKILWREDSSNHTDDYQRNFFRHQVMPRLEELNPNFVDTFRNTLERLEGAALLTKAYIKTFHTSIVSERDNEVIVDFRKLSATVSPTVVLWELIKDFGFNYDQCKQMVLAEQPGKKFVSPTHQLHLDRNNYIITKTEHARPFAVSIEAGATTVEGGKSKLTFKEVGSSDFELRKDSTLAQLDAGLLKYPLVWRTWKAGDYFVPLGMHQEKKLSDFLIDLKIPFNQKADITVLESGGNIIWVVGFRLSDRFKVTPDTKQVLVIEEERWGAPPK
jgi:tRNA(Ile)-lysidine synthase